MSIDPKHPVRKIPTSHRSITGAMPTAEKVSQQFESTLERDLMYLLRFDPYVDKFVAQPVKIEYQDKAGSNHTYTPDIIIYHRKDIAPAKKMRTILGEVKYVDDLCKNFREYHPKFRAAMRYAKERNWIFRVFTEKHIRGPYLDNAKFLLPYLDNKHEQNIIDSVIVRIEELRESSPQELIASFYLDKWNQAMLLPVVWQLIARRSIGVNLQQPLTMSSRIWRMYYE